MDDRASERDAGVCTRTSTVIETNRLALRPLQPDDLDALLRIFTEPRGMAAFASDPLDRDQMRRIAICEDARGIPEDDLTSLGIRGIDAQCVLVHQRCAAGAASALPSSLVVHPRSRGGDIVEASCQGGSHARTPAAPSPDR